MKIEIGTTFPSHFKSSYPEEFELFSHFDDVRNSDGFVCGNHMERKWKA